MEYNCINNEECGNKLTYNGRGRKSTRCKKCQELYSKKLRRDAYRKKVKNNVKITKCQYKVNKENICESIIPYVTKKPKYCIKHARKIRLEWMRCYYINDKITHCKKCGITIRYETKRPEFCSLCRDREKINERRLHIIKRRGI
jgi:hypothetical protein